MNPDDLRAYMQRLHDDNGGLTSQVVVEAARPVSSPIHAMVFDRGVEEAAEAHYLARAQALIRKVRVRYVAPDDTPTDVRAFMSVPGAEPPARVYRRIEAVAEDPLLRAMVLRDAEREWRTLKLRYRHLAEFMEMVRGDILGEEAA